MSLAPEVLGNLLKRRATRMYPEEKVEPPEAFRGKLGFDREKCIGCGLCWRVCPSSAAKESRDEKGRRPVFHIGKCIYCYLCVEVCPRKAIKPGKEYAVVVFDKRELQVK